MALILCVEDDLDVRESLAGLLADDRHDVVTAGNGLEALGRMAKEPRPDLVVLDLMMPGMSGWELLLERSGSTELAEVPVLVTSVFQPQAGQLSPRDAYLAKPYTTDELLETVRVMLERR